jgi:hypothetical protein
MSVFAAAAVSTIVAVAQAAAFQPPVDLDRPGVLDSVQRDNPQLHLKITQIRNLATRMPCLGDEFKLTLAVKFEVKDAACGLLLKTSYPAKRTFSFTLGETRYVTVVDMDESENRLIPAR